MNELQMTADKMKVQAEELHIKILANGQVLANTLLEFAKNLKEMRDKRLYQSIGYASFEEYVEQAVGIRQRQAYNYITTFERLGAKYMEANAGLGISKLQLLAEIPAQERESFLDDNDLAGMSVSEIKEKIKEANDRGQQLSMLENELADAKSSEKTFKLEMERLQRVNAELEQKFKESKSKAIEIVQKEPDAETVAEIRRQAMEEAKAEEKKAREELERKAEERLLEVEQRAAESMERAVKEAAEKAKQEAEQALQEKITQQQAQTEAATRRAEELTKRLEVESSKETVKFSLLFNQIQETAGQMQDIIEGLKQAGDTEQAEKLGNALRAALTQVLEAVE